jgi:carbonic anhydrase
MRKFILAIFCFAGLGFFAGFAAFAEGSASADASLKALVEGNARFSSSKPLRPNSGLDRVAALASGQKPYAIVLTCSDSRLPPELIFDSGFGELFVVRVAGNVADVDELASIEYGAEHLGAPLVLVLGHGSCGAVTAVVQGGALGGNLGGLLDNVIGVFKGETFPPGTDEKTKIAATIKANVLNSMRDILSRSSILRELAEKGEIKVLGGLYDLSDGKVEMIGAHPDQARILAGGESGTAGAAKPAQAAYLFVPGGVAVLLALAFFLFVSAKRPLKGLKALGRFIASFLSVAVACAAIGLNDIALPGAANPMRMAGLAIAFLAVAAFGVCASFSHVRAFKRFFEEAARARGA